MTKFSTIDLSSTSAEKCFFGYLAMWKSNFSVHVSIGLNFRHTSKKIKGGSPKKILEKKNVFPKSMSNLGRLTVLGLAPEFPIPMWGRWMSKPCPRHAMPCSVDVLPGLGPYVVTQCQCTLQNDHSRTCAGYVLPDLGPEFPTVNA